MKYKNKVRQFGKKYPNLYFFMLFFPKHTDLKIHLSNWCYIFIIINSEVWITKDIWLFVREPNIYDGVFFVNIVSEFWPKYIFARKFHHKCFTYNLKYAFDIAGYRKGDLVELKQSKQLYRRWNRTF